MLASVAMKLPRLRTILLTPLVLFALFYVFGVIVVSFDDRTVAVLDSQPAAHESIAIFGASGTAGDGILKAALADPDISTIQVFTRRVTPRMEEGVDAVVVTAHAGPTVRHFINGVPHGNRPSVESYFEISVDVSAEAFATPRNIAWSVTA